jgi:hypothetical protein
LLAYLAFLWLCTAPAVSAAPVQPQCQLHRAAQPAVTRLQTAMAQGRFIAYQPISLQVVDGRSTEADANSIRADLTELRTRFDALITYDAVHGAQEIPAIAAALKFRALIIGVWNPADAAQHRCCARGRAPLPESRRRHLARQRAAVLASQRPGHSECSDRPRARAGAAGGALHE